MYVTQLSSMRADADAPRAVQLTPCLHPSCTPPASTSLLNERQQYSKHVERHHAHMLSGEQYAKARPPRPTTHFLMNSTSSSVTLPRRSAAPS